MNHIVQNLLDSIGEFLTKPRVRKTTNPLDNGSEPAEYTVGDYTFANCGYCKKRAGCNAFRADIFPDAMYVLDSNNEDMEAALEQAVELREEALQEGHYAYEAGGVYSVLSAIKFGDATMDDILDDIAHAKPSFGDIDKPPTLTMIGFGTLSPEDLMNILNHEGPFGDEPPEVLH